MPQENDGFHLYPASKRLQSESLEDNVLDVEALVAVATPEECNLLPSPCGNTRAEDVSPPQRLMVTN